MAASVTAGTFGRSLALSCGGEASSASTPLLRRFGKRRGQQGSLAHSETVSAPSRFGPEHLVRPSTGAQALT